MILLDTNVVSETMRPVPDARVIAWLNAQSVDTIYLSTISLAELLLGATILPDGRRKANITAALTEKTKELFGSRILSFDLPCAKAYATIVRNARAVGRSIGFADGLIAAIATARDFTVATRDTAPFIAAGLRVINPWIAPGLGSHHEEL